MELLETLNRTMKLAMDDGRVDSYEEAQTLFSSFRLQIQVHSGFSMTSAIEAAVLTLLNAAPKTFLGGVVLIGPLHERCTMAWFANKTLGEVAEQFDVTTAANTSTHIPTISVGGGTPQDSTFWLGISLYPDGFTLSPDFAECGCLESPVEAGVTAAGAALNEVFQYIYRNAPLAGQRDVHMKLPTSVSMNGPESIWITGLGHLGQAFLWTAALADRERWPRFVRLTDYDIVSRSSLSTCLLVTTEDIGRKKVDVVAEQLEVLGIKVQRDYECLNLDSGSVQSEQELSVIAVDNVTLRRSLDRIKATRILEAGIGDGSDAFTRIQLHVFPGPRKARDIWVGDDPRSASKLDLTKPAYQALLAESGDECGTALVAGRSIATPFVGAFAGALLSTLASDKHNDNYAWCYDVNSL